MAMEATTFETMVPSRFITFSFPNPNSSESELRVAVLDSPIQPKDLPQVAAMFVPENRETDWIFSTESGHLQLLFNTSSISRLILIGNLPLKAPRVYHRSSCDHDSVRRQQLEVSCKPLLYALCPKILFKNRIPEVPILKFEDNVISSLVLDTCLGPVVGEMLVEDVEMESKSDHYRSEKREFRRRLRFKRMPNLIQTEVVIFPSEDFIVSSAKIEEIKFTLDLGILVHPYLAPLVAGISLISDYIDNKIEHGIRPKALCLGVGGGALVTLLINQLGFEVQGVEADKEVMIVAKKCFGLEDTAEYFHVHVGDAIEFTKKLALLNINSITNSSTGEDSAKFDVIMVDLDSNDVRTGVSAPPLEFISEHVLKAARSCLHDSGILAINIIPPTKCIREQLILHFQEAFQELYTVEVGNGENFVLVAVASPVVSSSHENNFLKKLRLLVSEACIHSIRKI